MLKAVIVLKTGELPPRLHDLIRLAEIAGLELDENMKSFLGFLSASYIQSRYPEDMIALSGKMSRSLAADTLRQTKEAISWLNSMIP